MPEYLLHSGTFAQNAHQIILCREDVREGLLKTRRQNEPLSALLHRRAFIPRQMLAAQLERLLAAMGQNEQFEVALVPRSAFAKLSVELICWSGGASLGWLQDGSGSVFSNDCEASASFYAAVGHVWAALLKGWKRKVTVAHTLRCWLAGRDLDVRETDSAMVRNWEVGASQQLKVVSRKTG